VTGVVVIGVGNRYRGDDGVGPAVLDALADLMPQGADLLELDGEASRLIDAWTGADVAYVIDAARPGGTPGRTTRIELGADDDLKAEVPAGAGGSHSLGVAPAAALARVLGRRPTRLVVIAVEGEAFEHGEELSPAVAASTRVVADAIAAELDGR
jgi:hydrogenase maturation protease